MRDPARLPSDLQRTVGTAGLERNLLRCHESQRTVSDLTGEQRAPHLVSDMLVLRQAEFGCQRELLRRQRPEEFTAGALAAAARFRADTAVLHVSSMTLAFFSALGARVGAGFQE